MAQGLSLPTVSIDGETADFMLPWVESAVLEDQEQGEIVRTMQGEYEFVPPVDTENSRWSLSWTRLTIEEMQVLAHLGTLPAVSFTDPLGRPCKAQFTAVRTPALNRLDEQGRLLYSGSAEVELLEALDLPWLPDFTYERGGGHDEEGPYRSFGAATQAGKFSELGWVNLTGNAALTADKQGVRIPESLLASLGDVSPSPVPSGTWDRSARAPAPHLPVTPLPHLKISSSHAGPRRGSFFVAFQRAAGGNA